MRSPFKTITLLGLIIITGFIYGGYSTQTTEARNRQELSGAIAHSSFLVELDQVNGQPSQFVFLNGTNPVISLGYENGWLWTEAAGTSVPQSLSQIFPQARQTVQMIPQAHLDSHVNFYLGDNSALWQQDIPVWNELLVRELYPGIDLRLSSSTDGWVVYLDLMPQADPMDIANARQGVVRLTQMFTPAPKTAAASTPSNQYNPEKLFYSVVFGGISSEAIKDIAVNDDGEVYVTGTTLTEFPNTMSYIPGAAAFRLSFVGKLQPDGSGFAYLTFFGSSEENEPTGLAVDSAGAAYVTGNFGSDFPHTPGAYLGRGPYTRAHLFKLDTQDGSLVYSANIGPAVANDVAVDSAGNAYMVGQTGFVTFPTTANAFSRETMLSSVSPVAIVVKLNAQGSALDYATFLNTPNDDNMTISDATAITVDDNGFAYITGQDASHLFPTTPGAFVQRTQRTRDIFVLKLDPTGSSLVYSAMFGGSGQEESEAIAVDPQGAVYVMGRGMTDFPAVEQIAGGERGDFLAKLSSDGSQLLSLVQIGDLNFNDLAVDSAGYAYLVGTTSSVTLPVSDNAFKSQCGETETGCAEGLERDGFLLQFDPETRQILYATYLGTGSAESIALNHQGETAIGGSATTPETFFTTANLADRSGSASQAYVMKWAFGSKAPAPIPTPTPVPTPAFDWGDIVNRKSDTIAFLEAPTFADVGLPAISAPGYGETTAAALLSTLQEKEAANQLTPDEASGFMRLTLQEEVMEAVYRAHIVEVDDLNRTTARLAEMFFDVRDFLIGKLGVLGERITAAIDRKIAAALNTWVQQHEAIGPYWKTAATILLDQMEGEVSPRSGVGSFFILEANQKTALPFVQETQPIIDRAVNAAQAAATFVGSDDGQVQMMLAERITAFNEEMGRRHEAQVSTREILDDTRDVYITTLPLGGPGVALNAIVELVATTTEIYQQVNFTGKNLTTRQNLLCDSQQALFPEGSSIIGTCPEETSQSGNLVFVAAHNQPQLQDSESEIASAEALIADFNNLHRAVLTNELDTSEPLLEKFAVSEEKFSQLIQEHLLTLSETGNDSEQFTLLSANVFEYELAMLNYYAALGFRYLAPDDEQVAAQLAATGANVAAKVDQYTQTADLKLSVVIDAPGPQAGADVPLAANVPIRSSAVAWWHWVLLGVGVLITIFWLMISVPNIPIPAAVQAAIGEHPIQIQLVLSVAIVMAGAGLLWNSRNPQVAPFPGPTTNEISDVQMTPAVTTTPTVANGQPSSTGSATATVFPSPTLELSPTLSPTILPTATPPQAAPTPTIPVSLFEKQIIGTSVQGNPIERYQFGDGEHVVIFVGGIHSGFAPSSTVLVERLIDYFSTNDQDLPENITLYIIPNLNPDSPVAPGQLAGRLNGNNVDLNRNWDCRWAADSAVLGNVVPAVGGASPLSEPETQSLAAFLLDVQPAAVIFWEARARDGLVTPGNCGARHTPSETLATIYGQAAGYRIIDFDSLTQDDLTGDVSNWLATMNIPSIFVLQPSYEEIDWPSNRDGILAVLNSWD